MIEKFDIAGYCRISVDEEQNRDNTSIENQKAIIEDYVRQKFPGSSLTFYEDRDRSGYTFEQREGYQKMRKQLLSHKLDILIVKDFSRFSRRNSRGLVELEDLRDYGVRIISIGDGIDFPNDDDWLKIQFQFLINEMPVTDTSKKVRSVVNGESALISSLDFTQLTVRVFCEFLSSLTRVYCCFFYHLRLYLVQSLILELHGILPVASGSHHALLEQF